MKSAKVLVIDPWSGAGIELLQSLSVSACKVDVAVLKHSLDGKRSRYLEKAYALPECCGAAAEALASLWLRESYEFVVPTSPEALGLLLSKAIPDEMYHCAALPERSVLKQSLDRAWCMDLAHRMGVRVPSRAIVNSVTPPPRVFPSVLQPRLRCLSVARAGTTHQSVVVRDEADWRRAMRSYTGADEVLQQEYIFGKSVEVLVLGKEGKLLWAFVSESVHEVPLLAGESSYRKSRGLPSKLIESSEALLAGLHWHGTAAVKYREAPDGNFYCTGVVPHLTPAMMLASHCGIDFSKGLLCLARGENPGPQPFPLAGRYARNIRNDVDWFKLNWKADRRDPLLRTFPVGRSLLEWLRPLAGHESWDFFRWSDPLPILAECGGVLREHAVKVLAKGREMLQKLYLKYLQQPRALRRLKKKRIASILFLCYGNICRSPLAEAIAARVFSQNMVSSAGFHHGAGRCSPDYVVEEAWKIGIDLSEHRSKTVTREMADKADLIVIMDLRNYNLLRAAFPDAVQKTVFLGMLLPQPMLEIRDPYNCPSLMPETARAITNGIDGIGKVLRVVT